MAAIPCVLKKKAMSAEVPSHEQLLYSTTVPLSPENSPVRPSKHPLQTLL